MRLSIALDERLPHPVEVVWRALTDAVAISEWLMVTPDFRPQVGARFRLKTRHLSPTGWIDAEVVELDPRQRMVWAWCSNDGNPPSSVVFELEGDVGGTRLRLTHTGEVEPVIGRLLTDGWPGRLQLLADVVTTKEER